MLLKPLNEWTLWQGTIQREHYCEPIRKPPMILPEIRSTIGGTKPPAERIWDEITRSYDLQSKKYWEGVKERAREYRARKTTNPYQ